MRWGRTIVTADLDYPRLLAQAGASEPGLILFRGGDWLETDAREQLSSLFVSLQAVEIFNSILVIDRDRIRRRRLPITR